MQARCHLVLIPGFGGFDALGQIEYYAGVTDLFQAWESPGGMPIVLHYFDNLPAAAVTARATRLRKYLAKLIARRVILPADRMVLVGHSTGGLDIRQFIKDLAESGSSKVQVEGGAAVEARTIRRCLDGVVFLSVPHWGTNIADWVHTYPVLRTATIRELQALVAGSQWFVIDEIEAALTAAAAWLTGSQMALAFKDALTEANPHFGLPGPSRVTEAQEAASELALYFREMSTDFRAIHDLMSQPVEDADSPAQFAGKRRWEELSEWDDPPIRTLSYATVGTRPYRFEPGRPAPVWDLINPLSYPVPEPGATTDILYQLCYRACAGGPLRWPEEAGIVTRMLGRVPPLPLEIWDNDGIVNTASMLWPRGEVVLVMGDHLDIVGHYEAMRAEPRGARFPSREYRAYDAFRTEPRFTRQTFRKVWHEIFTFAAAPD